MLSPNCLDNKLSLLMPGVGPFCVPAWRAKSWMETRGLLEVKYRGDPPFSAEPALDTGATRFTVKESDGT